MTGIGRCPPPWHGGSGTSSLPVAPSRWTRTCSATSPRCSAGRRSRGRGRRSCASRTSSQLSMERCRQVLACHGSRLLRAFRSAWPGTAPAFPGWLGRIRARGLPGEHAHGGDADARCRIRSKAQPKITRLTRRATGSNPRHPSRTVESRRMEPSCVSFHSWLLMALFGRAWPPMPLKISGDDGGVISSYATARRRAGPPPSTEGSSRHDTTRTGASSAKRPNKVLLVPACIRYTHRSFVACTAASTRFRAPSLRRISWTCDFTVFSLRCT